MKITPEQISMLCEEVEASARRYIFKRVHKSDLRDLDISVDLSKSESLDAKIDVKIELKPSAKGIDVNSLVRGAVEVATKVIERRLKELKVEGRT